MNPLLPRKVGHKKHRLFFSDRKKFLTGQPQPHTHRQTHTHTRRERERSFHGRETRRRKKKIETCQDILGKSSPSERNAATGKDEDVDVGSSDDDDGAEDDGDGDEVKKSAASRNAAWTRPKS